LGSKWLRRTALLFEQKKELPMSKKDYRKLSGQVGIYKHQNTKNYLAMKKIDGKLHQKTFSSLFEAKKWHNSFNGEIEQLNESHCSTLKEVWQVMQNVHFPILATTTKAIWLRRYGPWERIEHLPMDQITPSTVTKFVQKLVDYYKSDFYQTSGRGRAGRCNLNNELNLFVTIFNWYKESEEFEREALSLTNPIKKKHKKMGFIKPVPDKRKKITLEHALTFFNYLKPLYRDLAKMQFFTAGRVGEVSGLQWFNIDLDNRRMLIKHSCIWDMTHKTFIELKPFPKNKEPRAVYITDEILEILKIRQCFKIKNCDYVFHVEGNPLNYGTIQLNYREAQRKGKLPYSGTHILRHGMATLARKVGGGLDAVMAMTGHKDIKLADHYSKCDEEDQKEVSLQIMEYIKKQKKFCEDHDVHDNVVSLFSKKLAQNH
jgi:integrase